MLLEDYEFPRHLEKLVISGADNIDDWHVYPPISAWANMFDKRKKRKITEKLAELKRLEVLDLTGLQLTSLPEGIGRLDQLDSLNLMFNFLEMNEELKKLKSLKKLKYLNIVGNRFDTVEIEKWNRSNPDLNIVYRL